MTISTPPVSSTGESSAEAIAMRGLAGFYVADCSATWVQIVDSLAENVLAAEGRSLVRLLKAGGFKLLRHPGWRLLLPQKAPQLPLTIPADFIVKGNNDKWIAFDLKRGWVARKLASRELYQREMWIRLIPEVAAISPPILRWDPDEMVFWEVYQPGRPAAVHDLDEGIKVLKRLWPRLAAVYKVRTSCERLEIPELRKDPPLEYVVREAGWERAWRRLEGQPVNQGLVHGDLKHLNVLVQADAIWVIDWGEQFFIGPPLFDVLYFLYWHSRSYTPETVVGRAFASADWLREPLPESLQPSAVEASLAVFAREMVDRIKEEGTRKRSLKKLVRFLKTAGGRLRELADA